jgi:hypothetical protein
MRHTPRLSWDKVSLFSHTLENLNSIISNISYLQTAFKHNHHAERGELHMAWYSLLLKCYHVSYAQQATERDHLAQTDAER